MIEFLTNPIFKYAILPISTAILGIAVKFVSRNDQYAKFKKEDMAVGLELGLSACLMFIVLTTDKAKKLIDTNKILSDMLNASPIDGIMASKIQSQAQLLSSNIASSGWLTFFLFLGLAGISTLVRKYGWQSETEMSTLIGVTIPLIFGILAIISVMAGVSQ